MKYFTTFTSAALIASTASASSIVHARAEDNFIPPPPAPVIPEVSGQQGKIQLQPVIDPKNMKPLEDALKPKTSHMIFLSTGTEAGAGVSVDAGLQMTMSRNAVNLGANNDVIDLSCSDQASGKATAVGGTETMTVKFKDNTTRDGALKLWQEGFQQGLYFIDAYGKGCGEADDIQIIEQAAGTEVTPTEDGGLVFKVKDVQDQNAVEEVQKAALVDMRVAWGKDHQEATQRGDSNPTGRRVRRQESPEVDMFEGAWPASGVFPTYAGKSEGQQKRGIDFSILGGWISGSTMTSDNINWPNENSGFKKVPSPWKAKDGQTPLEGWKLTDKDGETNNGVWCVDCGIQGKFSTSGYVKWAVKGDTQVTVFVGLDDAKASAHVGFNYEKAVAKDKDLIEKIFTIPVSPFSIGGLLVVGPAFRVIPYVKASLKTTGQALIGGQFTWDNAVAKYDRLSGKGLETSGWAPESEARLDVNAEISAEAAAGMRLSFDFGVTSNLMDNTIGLSILDDPSFYVTGEAGFAGSVTKGTDGQWTAKAGSTVDGCNGVQAKVGFQNRLYAKVGLAVKTWEWDLVNPDVMKKDLASYCLDYSKILSLLNGGATCMANEQCIAGNQAS